MLAKGLCRLLLLLLLLLELLLLLKLLLLLLRLLLLLLGICISASPFQRRLHSLQWNSRALGQTSWSRRHQRLTGP